MLIIAFLPLEIIVLIVTVIVFHDQKKNERFLENIYGKYGVNMKVRVTDIYHTFISDTNSNNHFISVAFTDRKGQEHEYSVSTGNRAAKGVQAGDFIDVCCLRTFFEDYGTVGDFYKENYRTREERMRGADLFAIPLMVISEDRDFKKRGRAHRIYVVCFYIAIIIFDVLLWFLYGHFGWSDNTGYVYAANAFTIILCAALVLLPVINAKRL